jgi:hypothetical protein
MALQSARRFKDESGKKYGKLTVLGFDGLRNGQPYFASRCDCGQELSVRGANLRSGNTTSCGCSRKKSAPRRGKTRLKTFGGAFVFGKFDPTARKTDWLTCCKFCGGCNLNSERKLRGRKAALCACLRPTHTSWQKMIERCTNKNHIQFADYGGRGITVSERWLSSFHAFLEDMGRRPDGMSIDRIDNDRGYHKANCRWATPKQQAATRRKPRRRKPRSKLGTS